jgi:CheY-like chemotaxis protein
MLLERRVPISPTLLREKLSYEGYAVTSTIDGNDALTLLATETFAAVTTNLTDNYPQKTTYKNTQYN